MKDYYKINEISKLYGIGPDSLRYYEKIGVLKPRRSENGYRLYSLGDIYRLNIVADLRQLDFSMAQIKEYLDYQSVEHVVELLRNEQELVKRQIKNLRAIEYSIRERLGSIERMSEVEGGAFEIKSFPRRLCLQLSAEMTRDDEMDFAIKKLHRKHEDKLRDFGRLSMGAVLSSKDIERGVYDLFHSVFFILGRSAEEYDFILPAGEYLSYFYRGSYEQSSAQIRHALSHARERGFSTVDEILEIYHIDNRFTIRPEEFITEIQARVLPLEV